MNNPWTFADSVPADRVALLTDRVQSFDSIVERLNEGAIVCARWSWGQHPDVQGHVRVEFEIAVDEDVADLFHNGIDGYRARYYASIEAGEAANAQCLGALAPILAAEAPSWALNTSAPGFPHEWPSIAVAEVQRSLTATGAKVWISEMALRERYETWEPTDVDEIVDELLVDRWMKAIRNVAQRFDSGELDNAQLAGTRAFRVDRIGVKGGFIVPGRPDLDAVVPPSKRERSRQIHERGFT